MWKFVCSLIAALVACPILACTYAMSVWEPSSDDDPPYFSIWGRKGARWIDGSGRRISFVPRRSPDTVARLIPFQEGELFGYKRDGVVVIPARYLYAGPFREGIATVVREGPCKPTTAGFCGAPWTLPSSATPKSLSVLDRTSGRGIPALPPCRYSFVDERGEPAGISEFHETGAFREGMAAVRVDKHWGYADKSFRIAIAPQYQGVGEFSEGLAAVYDGKGYSYIDRSGTVCIPGPFEAADAFHEGLAAVQQDGKSHYIDLTGKQAVRGTFPHAGRFFHGLANVQFGGGKLAYIDRKGRVVYQWKLR